MVTILDCVHAMLWSNEMSTYVVTIFRTPARTKHSILTKGVHLFRLDCIDSFKLITSNFQGTSRQAMGYGSAAYKGAASG